MKPTISKDGTIRADLKIPIRLSLHDMAVLTVSYLGIDHSDLNALLRWIMLSSKKELLDTIRRAVRDEGVTGAYRRIDEYEEDWASAVERQLAVKFPEMRPSEAQKVAIAKFGLGGAE